MPVYRCTGRDVYHGHPREWWVEAPTWGEAGVLVRSRGLEVEAIEEADPAGRPVASPLLRYIGPSGSDGAAPPTAPPTAEGVSERRALWRRRGRLALAGVGCAAVLAAGVWFTLRAREHLGRGRPPVQGMP